MPVRDRRSPVTFWFLTALLAALLGLPLGAHAAPTKVIVKRPQALAINAGAVQITGAPDALTPGGTLEVTPLTLASAQRDPRDFGLKGPYVVSSKGVQLQIAHASYRRQLTVTMTVPRSAGSHPVMVYKTATGWGRVKAKRISPTKIRATLTPRQLRNAGGAGAKELGLSAPKHENLLGLGTVQQWIVGAWQQVEGFVANTIGNRLAGILGGRTAPLACSPKPDWINVIGSRSGIVHVCGKENTDASGRVRGELQLKSNRGYFIAVTIPDSPDYVWVANQSDGDRQVIASALGFDKNRRVMLSPGQWMTIGYTRPAAGALREISLSAGPDQNSLKLIAASFLTDLLPVDNDVSQARIASVIGLCDVFKGNFKPSPGVLSAAVSCLADRIPDLAGNRNIFPKGLPGGMPVEKLRSGLSKALKVKTVLTNFTTVAGILMSDAYVDPVYFSVAGPGRAAPDVPVTPITPTTPTTPAPPVGGGGSSPPPPAQVTLTVYNQVTNGPSAMREDTPAYLSTVPQNFCRRDGCAIGGTDRNTGGTYYPAVCQLNGARTTNGNDGNANDDGNPGLFSSTRWYGINLGGSRGYISEVWINPGQRGGLGLPGC